MFVSLCVIGFFVFITVVCLLCVLPGEAKLTLLMVLFVICIAVSGFAGVMAQITAQASPPVP